MNLGKKIRIAREDLGLNQIELADKLDITSRTLQNYEYGTSVPDIKTVQKMAKIFKVKIDYFLDENFDVSIDVSDDASVDKNDVSLSNLKEVGIDNDEDSNIIAIPYYEDTYASAGYGVINYDEAPATLKLSESFLRGFLNISGDLSQIHALNSRGDSMEPTITGGELLFVRAIQNELSVVSGYVYTINYDGDTFVKRLEKNPVTKTITLFSDNEKYEPIVIKGQNLKSCNIVGRVVAHIKKGVI